MTERIPTLLEETVSTSRPSLIGLVSSEFSLDGMNADFMRKKQNGFYVMIDLPGAVEF